MEGKFQEREDNNRTSSSKNCEGGVDNDDSKVELFMNKVTTKLNVYSLSPSPLHSPWTLWTSSAPKRSGKEEYMSGLQKVKMVFTTSEFWNSYRNMVKPSELGVGGIKISMMRDDRTPLWEHPQNQDGGCFVARLEKIQIDWVWEQLLLLAIGEELHQHFHPEDELCGISLCEKKKVFVLSIWNGKADKAGSSTLHGFLLDRFPFLGLKDYFYNAHKTHAAYEDHGGQEKMKYENDWRKV